MESVRDASCVVCYRHTISPDAAAIIEETHAELMESFGSRQ